MVIIVALKFAVSSHFPLPKNSHTSFPFSQMARQVIEEPIEDKINRMYVCPVLDVDRFSHRKNEKGNRNRDCALGCSIEVIDTT